ncbi:hypothetical protein EZI54_05920 [Marinobacter halodurans]|uniref:Uncharacterized protein n=1 Tax=Marinobacter halodurans TaxID=2528979 RepID=A0ABY1ZNC5_9GAMM|nr:hypothetical protein [Marinobacter halodurans]TBW57985.1 hypothetical protein EZI54_05920 [Marinobacter halodurans]
MSRGYKAISLFWADGYPPGALNGDPTGLVFCSKEADLNFPMEDRYFRARYRKLDTSRRLSNGFRSDLKFQADSDNRLVFALYPEFETLSDEHIVGEGSEALGEGTLIIRKPIYEDRNGYFDLIRERVKIGAKAYLVEGSRKIVELEIFEVINEI